MALGSFLNVLGGSGGSGGGGGGGGTPAGSNGDIQINSSGSFGALTPGTGVSTFIATPSSANLAAALTNETGTGLVAFATGPTFIGRNDTGAVITTSIAMASPPTLDVTQAWVTRSIAAPETLAFSATPSTGTGILLTYTADATNRTITFPASLYSYDQQAVVANTVIAASTSKTLKFVREAARWTVYGDGVPTTGTGSYVLATSPTLVTPALGTPASGVMTNVTGVPIAALVAGTLAGTATLAENVSVALDPAGSADGKFTGITVTGTSGYSQAFGDVVMLDPNQSPGRWELASVSAAAGAVGDCRGLLAMVVVTATDGNTGTLLLTGIIRADANFPTLTVNGAVYATTSGDITQTQPSTTDHVIRLLGGALTADEMFFRPDNTWITHT